MMHYNIRVEHLGTDKQGNPKRKKNNYVVKALSSMEALITATTEFTKTLKDIEIESVAKMLGVTDYYEQRANLHDDSQIFRLRLKYEKHSEFALVRANNSELAITEFTEQYNSIVNDYEIASVSSTNFVDVIEPETVKQETI